MEPGLGGEVVRFDCPGNAGCPAHASQSTPAPQPGVPDPGTETAERQGCVHHSTRTLSAFLCRLESPGAAGAWGGVGVVLVVQMGEGGGVASSTSGSSQTSWTLTRMAYVRPGRRPFTLTCVSGPRYCMRGKVGGVACHTFQRVFDCEAWHSRGRGDTCMPHGASLSHPKGQP